MREVAAVQITSFDAAHQAGVIDLIVGIQQREYGLAITAADQPDLGAIPSFYQQGAGNFWVALDAGKVVGTIGLREFAPRQGALRKMFVSPDYRGRAGVAGQLLATLVDWARRHHIEAITLGTTDRFLAAHRFYEKNGFARIAETDLPSGFPRMAVDSRFYAVTLDGPWKVVRRLNAEEIEERLHEFGALLRACVDDGASIGFLPPLGDADAAAYWHGVADRVRSGEACLLSVADAVGRLAGCVQLALETRANGTHRAEVAKLMVDPTRRRQGLGRALMQALEVEARRRGRTTLVLDTRAGDPSERLYGSLGYVRAGEIPRYARSADGRLDGTAIYFKLLED